MAQYKAQGIDQKLVAANVLSNLKSARDYASLFNNEAVVELGKSTSTMVVRTKPVVTLAATPADRDGLLPRTSAASNKIEVSLDQDEYAKIAIDPLDVFPEKQSAEVGEAIAEAIITAGNADLLAELVANGTAAYLGETFTKTMSADKVWDAILNETANVVATFTGDFTMFVGASFWARLASGAAVLKSASDPRSQAVTLSGVQRLEVVPDAAMAAAGALAVVAHRNAAVQGRVLDRLHTSREDADDILFARVRFGSHVTDEGAVIALKDGIEA